MVEAAIFDLPLARPAPDAPVETLWVLLTAFLHGEPAPRAGNLSFNRNGYTRVGFDG